MPIHPIVGAHYRPPAKAILSILPIGQELELIPDPYGENTGNFHDDPNAIAVWIDGSSINTNLELQEVEEKLHAYGFSTDQIVSESWHLGYIPREVAKDIHLDGPLRAKFCVGGNGGPRVEFSL